VSKSVHQSLTCGTEHYIATCRACFDSGGVPAPFPASTSAAASTSSAGAAAAATPEKTTKATTPTSQRPPSSASSADRLQKRRSKTSAAAEVEAFGPESAVKAPRAGAAAAAAEALRSGDAEYAEVAGRCRLTLGSPHVERAGIQRLKFE